MLKCTRVTSSCECARSKSRGSKDSAERTRWFALSDTFLSVYKGREEFEARGTARANSYPLARYELRGVELTPFCEPAHARFVVQLLIPLDPQQQQQRQAASSKKKGSPEHDGIDACPMDRLIVRFESVRSRSCILPLPLFTSCSLLHVIEMDI